MSIYVSGTNEATIPITIDSVKDIESYRMTRCTYFSIENSEPVLGWSLKTADVDISFFMMELSGVITSPPGDNRYFDTPDALDHIFDVIEKNDELYVEANDIWLPNVLFESIGKRPGRGDVYRIGFDLFKTAYRLRDEVATDEEFMQIIKQLEVMVELEFSENETSALTDWNHRQIEINRSRYHENPEAMLPKKDDNQKPLPPLTV